MMGRLLRGVYALVLHFCLATLLAEGIMLFYVLSHWPIDADKFAKIVAVAQGIEVASPSAAPERTAEPASTEQVAFDQILERRAMMDKSLQLREMALARALAQLKTEQQKLSDETARLQQQQIAYRAELDSLINGKKPQGREQAGRILETVKPKLAKELVLRMLENKETEEVVMLFRDMADTKRAKILAEFKTPDETKKIDEVVRLIRQGVPEAPLAEKAKEQLQKPGTPP